MVDFRYVLVAASIAIFGLGAVSRAADLPPADGLVVLTVVGNIEHTNRQPFDEFEDPFTNYHERKFDKATEFDLVMLEALGMREIEVKHEAWPRSLRLAGPRLKDVLETIGAKPKLLTMISLDGFAVELSDQDLTKEDWIVAIHLDGKPMSLGQRGPIWIGFDPGKDKTITDEEEATWPWAAFFIQID